LHFLNSFYQIWFLIALTLDFLYIQKFSKHKMILFYSCLLHNTLSISGSAESNSVSLILVINQLNAQNLVL